jgi:serine/threonine-protein kinase
MWSAFVVIGMLTVMLWSGRPLRLRTLRLCEIIPFGLPLAQVTWYYVDLFWRDHFLFNTFRANEFYVSFLVSAFSLYYVAAIVAYGIFIPNTGRRCGAVVAGMALVPVALMVGVILGEDAIRTMYLADFLGYFFIVVIWMGTAVALAIAGSHRIEVLRRAVIAARQMGQYRLKQRLGAGGMGEVYLAEHVLLRRPCALKLIRPEQAGDRKHLVRFEREVQTTATLTHPNTIQVFDYGHTDDGTFYYVMEYLPGLNLEELVKRHGPLLPERAVHLLRQVCRALCEAHGIGLIHRDIKPSNIITTTRGGLCDVAKLLDFGLVRSHGEGRDPTGPTQEGMVAGTPAYMSPEQADARQHLDARSDIYSLGGVAYFLLTGQPPFVRPSTLQTLLAHLSEPPVPPDQLRPELPGDLQAVVLRCLEKDPARRFGDVRAMERALAGCQAAGQWTEERAAEWWDGLDRAEKNR